MSKRKGPSDDNPNGGIVDFLMGVLTDPDWTPPSCLCRTDFTDLLVSGPKCHLKTLHCNSLMVA